MRSLLCAALALFVVSCGQWGSDAEVSTVKVDLENLCQAEEMFEGYDYLRLETTEEAMLADIWRVQLRGDLIYIMDSRSKSPLFVFDRRGKYVGKLDRRGRARNEYSEITDFDVVGERIYILSRGEKKINIYSTTDFSYERSIKLDDWYSYMMVMEGERICLYAERGNNGGYNFSIREIDSEEYIARFDEFEVGASYSFMTSPFCVNGDGRIFVTKPFDHTIYELTTKSMESHCRVEFNTALRLPEVTPSTKYQTLADEFRNKPVVRHITGVQRSGGNLYMSYLYFVEGRGLMDHITRVDAEGGVSTYRATAASSGSKFLYTPKVITIVDDVVVGYLPSLVLSQAAKYRQDDRSYDITDEDNPVLFFSKLR